MPSISMPNRRRVIYDRKLSGIYIDENNEQHHIPHELVDVVEYMDNMCQAKERLASSVVKISNILQEDVYRCDKPEECDSCHDKESCTQKRVGEIMANLIKDGYVTSDDY